jgi:hypothetical protein
MDRTKSRDPRINTPPATPERAEFLQNLLNKKAGLDHQKAGLDLQKAVLDLQQGKIEQEIHQLQIELQELEQQAEKSLQDHGPHPKRPSCLRDPRLYNDDFIRRMLRGKVPGYIQPQNPITGIPSTSVTTDIDNPLPASPTTPVLNNFPAINKEAMWPHAKHPVQGLNILFPMRESPAATGSTISSPRQPKEGS